MRIYKYCIILILLVFGVSQAYSHEGCAENFADFLTGENIVNADTLENSIRLNKKCQNIEVHFRFDKSDLDLDYMDNYASLQKFAHKIDSIGIAKIDSIVIVSQSSPEGVYEHNLKLSRNRAKTMYNYIADEFPELNDLLYIHADGESWAQLREYVKNDKLMKNSTIEKVLSIIDADVNVGTKKWRLSQLPIYKYLLKTYYPIIRNSTFYILYYTEVIPKYDLPKFDIEEKELKFDATVPTSLVGVTPIKPVLEEWTRKLHVKTNALPWGFMIANIAGEIDVVPHVSFTLPLFYSALNYFTSTVKFRTFAIQPELRYWLDENNKGFFAGAHFGLFSYNVALNGDKRYQDHNGNSPGIGGGISVGYRMPISKDNRWNIEFTIGAGVYDLHYDEFYNTKNGKLIGTYHKTYWGIDNVGVNISYSFDINKVVK